MVPCDSRMKIAPLLLSFCLCLIAGAEPSPSLVADRAAIEKIYHEHRSGTKPAFEQAMPATLLDQLVQADRRREWVLHQAYGIEVTPAMVAGECERINTTTRAPEILAEIKHALGDDPARFARSMARPLLVGRILRERFDNDDALHAPQRAAAERARQALLAKNPVGGMLETTWQLTPRPAADAPAAPATVPQAPHASSSSGSYSNEASAQVAQTLGGGAEAAGDRRAYFEDLDPELQKVLRIQLQKPGDVSAVIEMPSGFLVFLTKEKSAATLTSSCLTVPKRSYDEWLAQQPVPSP